VSRNFGSISQWEQFTTKPQNAESVINHEPLELLQTADVIFRDEERSHAFMECGRVHLRLSGSHPSSSGSHPREHMRHRGRLRKPERVGRLSVVTMGMVLIPGEDPASGYCVNTAPSRGVPRCLRLLVRRACVSIYALWNSMVKIRTRARSGGQVSSFAEYIVTGSQVPVHMNHRSWRSLG